MSTVTTISLPATAIARLTAAVAAIQGVKFVGVTYRSKESGELARHTLILGADYNTQVMQSRDMLAMRPTCEGDASRLETLDKGVRNAGSRLAAFMALPDVERDMETEGKLFQGVTDAKQAKKLFLASLSPERAAAAELFNSYNETLAFHTIGEQNPNYTKAGLYETIVPGLVVSLADGTFELRGLSHAKTVIEAGTFAHVNSSAKTLAKQAIVKTLPVGRYRSLSLDAGALESVRIGGGEIDVS